MVHQAEARQQNSSSQSLPPFSKTEAHPLPQQGDPGADSSTGFPVQGTGLQLCGIPDPVQPRASCLADISGPGSNRLILPGMVTIAKFLCGQHIKATLVASGTWLQTVASCVLSTSTLCYGETSSYCSTVRTSQSCPGCFRLSRCSTHIGSKPSAVLAVQTALGNWVAVFQINDYATKVNYQPFPLCIQLSVCFSIQKGS